MRTISLSTVPQINKKSKEQYSTVFTYSLSCLYANKFLGISPASPANKIESEIPRTRKMHLTYTTPFPTYEDPDFWLKRVRTVKRYRNYAWYYFDSELFSFLYISSNQLYQFKISATCTTIRALKPSHHVEGDRSTHNRGNATWSACQERKLEIWIVFLLQVWMFPSSPMLCLLFSCDAYGTGMSLKMWQNKSQIRNADWLINWLYCYMLLSAWSIGQSLILMFLFLPLNR